jgi:hypothetical protein
MVASRDRTSEEEDEDDEEEEKEDSMTLANDVRVGP